MKSKFTAPIALGLILLIVAGWFGFNQYTENNLMRNHLEAQYQRAFFSMAGHIRNVEVQLGKSLVSGSPNQNIVMFSDIWQQSYAAQTDLGQLPLFNLALLRTSTFLTQLGDFSYTLAKQNARGIPLTSEQTAMLEELHTQAGIISREISQVEQQINGPNFRWHRLRQEIADREDELAEDLQADGRLKALDKQMQEFPTLIYDGPFSDHMRDRKPSNLTGEVVTQEDAQNIVMEFLNMTEKEYNVETVNRTDGVIAAYSFDLRPTEGQEWVYLDVSQTGGHIVYYTNTRNVGEGGLTREDATERAEDFVHNLGHDRMIPSYSIVRGNIATIVLVNEQDDIIIYPEQVKVQVAMDNGDIIGYEASQYLMTSKDREIPQVTLTEEEAEEQINNRLTVENIRLAIIPTESLREVLTYEIRTKLGPDTYLIYINALTGIEERILQLIDVEGGTLTM